MRVGGQERIGCYRLDPREQHLREPEWRAAENLELWLPQRTRHSLRTDDQIAVGP